MLAHEDADTSMIENVHMRKMDPLLLTATGMTVGQAVLIKEMFH